MGNAPCHNQASVFSNFKLVQLPPNCSLMLQPVDQGVFGLSMSFMKAGYRSTLIQPVMQPLGDKCGLVEDFTHYVSVDDRLFEEEIACLEFYDEESLDEFISSQAKHRKEEDKCETVNVPQVISIREAQKLLDPWKLFALANVRSSVDYWSVQ
ncbi:unnamed protein product [Echinostoma caproni]|uniref:SET domain-containing protein n=1 Tax=Echinostoma caproni TaxID=27848 RepID=A0A183AQP6_9TREM|nr:unnamed protein product [Echinostoma caproni]